MPADRYNSRRRTVRQIGLLCLAVGIVLRITLALRAGLGYDEVFVMGVGLDEILDAPRAALFDVPARRSNAVTPLWWWLQAIPTLALGEVSRTALRLIPLALGLATLGLSAIIAARRLGRPAALGVITFAALSDILAFSNARGEYAESLLVAASLPALLLVGARRGQALRGLLWLTILMTHAGKGALIVAGLLMAEAIFLALRRPPRPVRQLAVTTAWLLPALLWLLAAQVLVFGGGPVQTDAGPHDSVFDALRAVTVGYGQVKAHMIATRFDALLPFLDGAIWPLSAIATIPLLAGVVAVMVTALRHRVRGRRRCLAVALLPAILLGALLVIGRGQTGARFHLMVLPPAWIVAAIGLPVLLRTGRGVRVGLLLLWLAHVAIAFSWTSWTARQLGPTWTAALALVVVITLAVSVCIRPVDRRRPAALLSAGLLVPLLLLAGPVRWAPAARFEPMVEQPTPARPEPLLARIDLARSGAADYPAAHGRTMHLSLSHYYLTSEPAVSARAARRAVTHAEREAQLHPASSTAWFYVGLARQAAGEPVERIRAAWQRASEIEPTPGLRKRLAELDD